MQHTKIHKLDIEVDQILVSRLLDVILGVWRRNDGPYPATKPSYSEAGIC